MPNTPIYTIRLTDADYKMAKKKQKIHKQKNFSALVRFAVDFLPDTKLPE